MNSESILCDICGKEIENHISTEYILNDNHLKCELLNIDRSIIKSPKKL